MRGIKILQQDFVLIKAGGGGGGGGGLMREGGRICGTLRYITCYKLMCSICVCVMPKVTSNFFSITWYYNFVPIYCDLLLMNIVYLLVA